MGGDREEEGANEFLDSGLVFPAESRPRFLGHPLSSGLLDRLRSPTLDVVPQI